MIKKLPFLILITFSLFVSAQQSYYDDVDLTKTGLDLKDELAIKITNTHTNFLTYTPDVWEASKVTDLDPNNSNNILLIYGYSDTDDNYITDRSRSKDDNGGSSGTDWNREHTFPKSLGNPNLGTTGPGSDAHHLRPSDVTFNSNRGSLPFTDSDGTATAINGGWYPGDEWKGDVARMMMYMYLRYGTQCLPSTVGDGDKTGTPDEMIDLFLTWNAEDPVSQIEENRNTYHENITNTYAQGNRNPFIDNPNLATQIWGGTVAENRWDSNIVSDTEAPSSPENLITSDITSSEITLSWDSATDNVAVIAYQVYVNNEINSTTGATSITLEDLKGSTTYSIYVVAKDSAGNISETTTIEATTLEAIIDTTEYCVSESFDNIGDSSSSYSDRSWTGNNNIEWNATLARTDQTLSDGSKAIAIRLGELTASSTSGGIGSFTVKTQRIFSGTSGTFDLNVNGEKVGEIPFTDEEQTIKINDINITGDVAISITNNSPSNENNRVVFDDLKWECYDGTASIDNNTISKIKIYPNPSSTGNITINSNNLEINTIAIYSIIGKKVFNKEKPEFINNTYNIENLNSGIYLMKLSNSTSTITKKLIIK